MQIIIVDDEPLILRGEGALVQRTLPKADVRLFSSPADAILYAKANRVDIALLDIQMHEMTGVELARDLKRMQPDVNVVEFQATIQKKAGAETYTFHDTMTDGLTYDPSSLSVSVAGSPVAASNYDTATASGDTLTIRFLSDYISELADDTVITITYSATVNANALTTDTENNTAYLSYGHNGTENSTPEVEVKVYDANILVNKFYKDGDEEKPLAGAGFVLKNSEGKYYKLNGNDIEWVDDIEEATEYLTDSTGALANGAKFSGLVSGSYKLEEKTVPACYNKAADADITITANDYTEANITQTADVENEAGTVLPSTGGVGTTIFYIVGSVLVVGAAVILIVRRCTRSTVA